MNEADVDIGRIKHDDPDLVAYWTCEEGSGYLVKDVTGKGHDLHIQQPPQWRVSSTSCPLLSALCYKACHLSMGVGQGMSSCMAFEFILLTLKSTLPWKSKANAHKPFGC